MLRTRHILVALSLLAGTASSAHAAVSVTLECMQTNKSSGSRDHSLYDIDYDAKTIRWYVINDDGTPAINAHNGEKTIKTFPIAVTERRVMWSSEHTGERYALNRYSGKLMVTRETSDNWLAQCIRWVPKN